MVLSLTRGNRASFNPVFSIKRSTTMSNHLSSNDYLEQLDYDDDDDDMLNENESLADSNTDSIGTDPSSDPSNFKLEISISEDESGNGATQSTSSSNNGQGLTKSESNKDAEMADAKTSGSNSASAPGSFPSGTTKPLKKDTLAISNETLWDIFDLVFECENYKSSLNPSSSGSSSASSKKSKVIYNPQFRDEMKHKYNLVRNAIFDKCNIKFDSIFESGAHDNNSYLVATLIPCLTQGTINTVDKNNTSALISWLQSEVQPELDKFWESVDGEVLEQKETGRPNQKSNSYNKSFFANLRKEIKFINVINKDMDERKKLMDGIVVDLASLISIGGSSKSTSPESPMATMGPLLAAKMVADTLPVKRISKFIPHLARFTYANNLVQINEIIVNEIKDVIVDNFTLRSAEEKALYVAQDLESVIEVFKPNSTLAPSSSKGFSTSNSFPSTNAPFLSSASDTKDVKMEEDEKPIKAEPNSHGNLHDGIQSSSPPLSGSSAVARHSVAFFPNNHRRTTSTSSVSSLLSGTSSISVPNGQFPLGVGSAAAAISSNSRPPSTPLPLSLFPAAGITSSSHSLSSLTTSAALSSVTGTESSSVAKSLTASDSETDIDEKKLVGPLLSPFLALNIISPNLENIYPDYLSFLHTVFSAWTNISSPPGSGNASGIGFSALGGAMSPPPIRPLFSIPENVKMQTALGGIYLTLMNHSTTQKVPAIAKCFSIMQHQLQTQPSSRIQLRDLDILKSKLVEVYNEWTASQPPPEVVPLALRVSSADLASSSARLKSSGSSSIRKGLSGAKSTVAGSKRIGSVNGSRVEKSNSIQKSGQRSTSSSAAAIGAVSDFALPLSGESSLPPSISALNLNKSRHKRNQSTSSTTSDGGKNSGVPSSLPSPCAKCFHNHKGNNCARKCYVCRMAKLAAQHGHIVELKTGPVSTSSSPTSTPGPAPRVSTPDSRSRSNSTTMSPNGGPNSPGGNQNYYNSGSRNHNMNGGLGRNNSMKTRNSNYSNGGHHHNGNYNSGTQHSGHTRTQSYSTNVFNNNNRRRTQSLSYQNGNNYQALNGGNYHNGSNNDGRFGYGNDNDHGNGGNDRSNHRNGHGRNHSNAANKFAMRLSSQYPSN